jgi:3-oxoacyl-ACP reductase-like protein
MGLFDSIKHAIFGDKGPLGTWAKDKPAAPQAPTAAPHPAAPAPAPATPAAPPPQAAPAQPVDVEAILTQKAAAYGKPNNWRTSIVDLLTLLGLDSSLSARKDLAQELGVHAGADGSAEQNIALHKAVMQALAKNGGKVPAELTD